MTHRFNKYIGKSLGVQRHVSDVLSSSTSSSFASAEVADKVDDKDESQAVSPRPLYLSKYINARRGVQRHVSDVSSSGSSLIRAGEPLDIVREGTEETHPTSSSGSDNDDDDGSHLSVPVLNPSLLPTWNQSSSDNDDPAPNVPPVPRPASRQEQPLSPSGDAAELERPTRGGDGNSRDGVAPTADSSSQPAARGTAANPQSRSPTREDSPGPAKDWRQALVPALRRSMADPPSQGLLGGRRPSQSSPQRFTSRAPAALTYLTMAEMTPTRDNSIARTDAAGSPAAFAYPLVISPDSVQYSPGGNAREKTADELLLEKLERDLELETTRTLTELRIRREGSTPH